MDVAMLDRTRVDAFAERMLGVLNGGALAIMTSIGHRTGLFDTMGNAGPSTSEEIAGRAGLDERYVREWLGSMVTGGVVDFDPESARYRLPAEHAACLTRDAAPNNVAAFAQYVPLLGGVEDRIIECFEQGGGLPYSEYPRFTEVMAEDSGQTVLPALEDAILPLVPGLVGALKDGIEVLDVGCGAGRAMNLLAWIYPESRFAGYDFLESNIAAARAEAERSGVGNVRFERKDVTSIGEPGRYDLITAFDAIHDQARPDLVLAEIARALTADGVFLMQDIKGSSHVHENVGHPMGTLLYTISCLHCMTVSLSAGGAGLGAMWGREKALQMLAAAGFANVTVHELPHDFQNLYYVARK